MRDPLHTPHLLLIRHGQTAWNAARRFLGRTDLPLDPTGHAQAAALGQRWAGQVTRVVCSPLTRTQQTAAALAAPITLDDAWIEMDQGELEGIDGPTFLARYPLLAPIWRDHPEDASPPGGERVSSVQARALAAFGPLCDALRAEAPTKPVALVSHQIVLASLLCAIAGEPLASLKRFFHEPTGVTTLRITPGGAQIVSFNDRTHLPSDSR